MRTSLAAATAACILAVSAIVGLVVLVHNSDVTTQRALQAQITQLRQHNARDLAALQAKTAGASADLITCGDLQATETYIDGIVSSQGALGPIQFVGPDSTVVSALPLPSHCINR